MGIIFNIEEAVQNSAFNVLQEPIKMILDNQVEAFEKDSIISKVFVMKTSDKYREEFRSKTTMDGFKPTEDMQPAGISDFEEGYSKQFVFQTWTNAFVVSKQAIEDNQMMDINASAFGFIKSYGRTRELYAVNMLGAALGKTNDDYRITDKSGLGMDTVDGTIDGTKQQYFHSAHKTVKLRGEAAPRVTQSNKFVANIAFDGSDPELEEKILDVIGQEYVKCNNMLNMMVKDVIDNNNNIEVVVADFLGIILEKVDDFSSVLSDKVSSMNLDLSQIDIDKIKPLLEKLGGLGE